MAYEGGTLKVPELHPLVLLSDFPNLKCKCPPVRRASHRISYSVTLELLRARVAMSNPIPIPQSHPIYNSSAHSATLATVSGAYEYSRAGSYSISYIGRMDRCILDSKVVDTDESNSGYRRCQSFAQRPADLPSLCVGIYTICNNATPKTLSWRPWDGSRSDSTDT